MSKFIQLSLIGLGLAFACAVAVEASGRAAAPGFEAGAEWSQAVNDIGAAYSWGR